MIQMLEVLKPFLPYLIIWYIFVCWIIWDYFTWRYYREKFIYDNDRLFKLSDYSNYGVDNL